MCQTGLGMLGLGTPAGRREVIPADLGIGVAVDRPVICVAEDETLGVGLADGRNQEAAVAAQVVHGMGNVREVENRDSSNTECRVIHLGVAADFHGGRGRVVLPLGLGQLAGSQYTLMYAVEVRAEVLP